MKDRKRHILVDINWFLIKVKVNSASIHDKEDGRILFNSIEDSFS